ncbi:Asp-tRNA(Asn)/Glu-tRNA(Gln) amidotransferase subunit GatA [Patescibacteria group bacterium]|nr:Asp-tRNA(Asn)/Glu-tRNA(Gln) amidotransferase subunit GatA [Patescibacteria group bacterium]MBU4367362.1 Asp-tRNA(Asn)/Glu-tRNA(Gln) amidotransferase subunit GatA [Patescibacteria group bacterium]MBU4461981.1 Asp-tRNA(Asn)/Glu-tRNA(Gln) amidotransferase subunit GatA [Patescibacteria group bacterium]MCG2699662.1 Asp-tRNA(Asn)/Glu-tRNA(Gln) amidotransferase subunit GatA [Candidatus Parcubacteria bacterium]
MEINKLTISALHEGFLKKDFSALEVAKKYLEQIQAKDKDISAFLTITEDLALSQAKEVDKLISEKKEIPVLAGVPCAVKDNILVEGIKCTAGSKILENYTAPYDATVIKKLKREGAVILGKTNLDEFAMGSSTENSAFKITKNPCDLSRVPGGSSGGSAAAVAAEECCYALGSDTNGSIRAPASFCGIVGFKPTYGAVSRYGLIAFGSSLDQIGPLTKTVEDAKIIFDVISGKDELDSTSVKPKASNFKCQVSDIRIGIPKEYFIKGIDPDVEAAVKKAINLIEKEGAKVEEISLPHTKYALAVYYIIAPAEASANLARYDGIKYGLSKNKKDDLLDVYLESRGKGFGPEVKRRIILGTYSLSSGYYDAYYKKAQQVRGLIKKDFEEAFKKIDLIFSPVCPTPAFKIGEKIKDPFSMYLTDILTSAASLAGLPGISVPCGKSQNLPIGLHIFGNCFEDNKILETASFIERLISL